MNIGIIGAGHIGSTLARRFVDVGHKVEIANSRGPETLGDVASQAGATAVDTKQAVRDKDLVVLTIPMKSVRKLPKGLFADVPEDTPVIDTCNYYPRERDGRIEAIENGLTESEWVAGQIGHSTIKVFNNMQFKRIAADGRPQGDPERLALPVSGDNLEQKALVMSLVDEIGFDPIDNGPLSESWRQQPGTPGYTNNKNAAGVRDQLAAATKTRPEKFKAAA